MKHNNAKLWLPLLFSYQTVKCPNRHEMLYVLIVITVHKCSTIYTHIYRLRYIFLIKLISCWKKSHVTAECRYALLVDDCCQPGIIKITISLSAGPSSARIFSNFCAIMFVLFQQFNVMFVRWKPQRLMMTMTSVTRANCICWYFSVTGLRIAIAATCITSHFMPPIQSTL